MNKTSNASKHRAPFSDEELERMTANDFYRLKLSEDERSRLREINMRRQREREDRSARLRVEEEPILAELREIGWSIKSVWDLVNTSGNYSQAIPILLRHLFMPYSDRTREGIARALAVAEPEVQKAWPLLAQEYRRTPAGRGLLAPGDIKEYRLGAKDGLACALSVAVTDATLPDLIALAKDASQGESRILLLSALRKRRRSNPLAARAIEELADDPDLKKEISSWRRN